MQIFNVSKYAVRQARELLKETGILALPEPQEAKNFVTKKQLNLRKFFTKIMIHQNNARKKIVFKKMYTCKVFVSF